MYNKKFRWNFLLQKTAGLDHTVEKRNYVAGATQPRQRILQTGSFFYAIGNSVGIPCCIKKPCRAGLHCGGKVDVAEATRRRRRILPSRILFYAQKWQEMYLLILFDHLRKRGFMLK